LLTKVNVPAHGITHKPLRFTALAAPWTALLQGPPGWRFGDGTTAHGNRVHHRYRRPGTYTVTVTEADQRGQTAQAAKNLTIQPPHR
jgi:chitodextrinase